MSTEKINFIANDTLSTGTRLEYKSKKGSGLFSKNPGMDRTPPGPRWNLWNGAELVFNLSLPKVLSVQLKWKIRAERADYRFAINDTQGEIRTQRDRGNVDTPYTEYSWDISQYVQTGDNIVKFCRTGGGAGPLGIHEISAEITPPAAYPNGNIDIDDIEVTQAIQDIVRHDVPLIENKKTVARVFVTVPETMSAGKLTGELKLTKGDKTYYVYSEGSLDVTNAQQDTLLKKRENVDNSLNFLLPGDVCSGEVDITLNGLYADISDDSYTVNIGTNKNRNVTFEKAPLLRLRVIGLRHKKHEDTDCPEQQPRQIDYDLIKSWLQRAFPVPDVEFSRIVTDVPQDFTIPVISSHTEKVWAQVAAIRHLDMAFSSIDRRTRYYGLAFDHRRLNAEGNFDECCKTYMTGKGYYRPDGADPSCVAAGSTGTPWFTKKGPEGEEIQLKIDSKTMFDQDASYGDWETAHELGHTLGRHHTFERNSDYPYAGNKIGDANRPCVGLDVGDDILKLERQALPYDKYSDIMSYDQRKWISDYTYKAILTRLRAEDALGQDGKGGGCAVKFEEGNFISVIVLNQKIVYVNPVSGGFVRTTTPDSSIHIRVHYQSSDESLPVEGRKRREDTRILSDAVFVDCVIKLNLGENETVSSIEYIEYLDEVGDQVRIIATKLVPSNAASIGNVTVAAATDGAKTVTWESTGGDPVFNVQVSRDSGASWETLAVGLKEKSFDIETNLFSDLKRTKVRIMATNGIEAEFSEAYVLG